MRINFNLPYSQVSRLLESPPLLEHTVGADSGTFDVLLGEISRSDPTAPLPSEPSAPSPTRDEDGGVMARFAFSQPSLKIPTATTPLPPVSHGETPPPVKDSTPAEVSPQSDIAPSIPKIVSARRVTGHQLANLPHAERLEVVRELVGDAGERHGVDPALSLAVAAAESSFNPLAVSSDGAESKGLFQLLDSTGRELHRRLSDSPHYDPFNPQSNVELGVGYLRRLLDLFSTPNALSNDQTTVPAANSSSLEKLAVAAFNAGEGRVAAAQSRAERAGADPSVYEDVAPYLPESTRQYVGRVLRFRGEFEDSAMG